ncbi:MAG: DsbA family oxidoreductase [Fimbriimonadaceae bacterium]
MPLIIPVAHDFTCPWCWIGLVQAKRLVAEEGVEIEWKGYELWPADLARPLPTAPTPPIPNKPAVPSRLDLILIADGLELPRAVKPPRMLTHNAHEAVEFAKLTGKGFELCEELYRAYWERGVTISEPHYLESLAGPHGLDPQGLRQAIHEHTFKDRIVGFDEPAYASGIFNVPTFTIGGERYAEQPYAVLVKAVRAATQP